MKKKVTILVLAVLLIGATGVTFALDEWMGKGEVVDVKCYTDKGAKGEGHAGCAKKCLGGGGEMGLLQADGTVIKLKAGEDKAAYDSLVELAGKQAEVKGSNADGVVTVAKARAAQ